MIKTEDYLIDDLNMEPGSPATTEGKEVKRRNRLNPRQVNRLMQVFDQTAKPKADIRHKLAEELGMHPRAVQIWFQNRRQKLKKESLEVNMTESIFPLNQAKLTLCDAKQVYSRDACYGLSFSNFPRLVKPTIVSGPSNEFHTPTNAALLSGLGLVSSHGSVHSSANPISISHAGYQDTVQSLDNNIHNSSLTLLQGCNSLPVPRDLSFSNMFDSVDLDIILGESLPSGTSISATSSEANYPDQIVDMSSTINDESSFMRAELDSFGLGLSTQIGMLHRHQSFAQNHPLKRKDYSCQNLCQFAPSSQELNNITSPPNTTRAKLQNMKRNASDAGLGLNQYSSMISTRLNQVPNRPINSRSYSDSYAAESYREAKKQRLFRVGNSNNSSHPTIVSTDQESSSTAGGLIDMLAYL